MKLLIVESPAKSKTISKYLGTGFKVLSSVGHVRDIPKSNKDAIDIEAGFKPHYIVNPDKNKVVENIVAHARKADEILLATDPDREGEAIAWHIAELLKEHLGGSKSKEAGVKNKIKRVTYHEITKEAIEEALKHPREIDTDLRKAQEARRVLDRLVGYDLSGLIWKKVRYGLSAGRVQSPALRILAEREREIQAFIPETYWTITADLASSAQKNIPFVCSEEPRDKKEVERIVREGERGAWHVLDVKETRAKKSPRAPFITSTLQQAASTRLGFAPSTTMRLAQRLYEAGHITYMRTDSTTLGKNALGQVAGVIEKKYGKELLQLRTYAKKSKNAQEAHEAIRPTTIAKESAGASQDERALYTLIRERTIASQMKDAQILRTKILTNIEGGVIPDFAVNGSRVIEAGWLIADPRSRGEDIEVPKLTTGDTLTLTALTAEERETTPPNRYSEAGLVKELEKRGIGRPSTYASTIRTIIERGYVEKDGKALRVTDTGDVVSAFLEKHFADYISDSFTAEMEDDLDSIANGERDYEKTLRDFYTPFQKEVKSKEKLDKITTLGNAPKEFPCPKCGAEMIYKLGKAGTFMSCGRFPDCDGARTREGGVVEDDKPIGKHPETGEEMYALDGRFGPYVQLGEKTKTNKKPRRASLPKDMKLEDVTVEIAAKLLLLPRELGLHPADNKPVTASIGRFGPFVVHDGDFRSLKEDSPYDVTLERALELLAQPKQPRKGVKIVKELGAHPRTGKQVVVYESKSGMHLKRGLKNIYLPSNADIKKFSLEDALELLKAK